MNKKLKVAIIGYGRFGKLLVKLLEPYVRIFVISRSEIIIKGIIQIDYSDLRAMDWVIPVVPISKLESIIKKISKYLRSGAMVMDVSSVKILPSEWMKKYLPSGVKILGTHPMFGPDSAKAGLRGLQMIFCPLRISRSELAGVKKIFKKMDLLIIETSPREHDKQVARSLALVHFIGRGLGTIGAKKQKISSLGFSRLLAVNETVENDTWQLFLDMHRFNPYAKKERESYLRSLIRLAKKLEK